jgi:hypothetical protein
MAGFQVTTEDFKTGQETDDFVWLYGVDDDKANRLTTALPDISEKLGCTPEEM